MLVHAHALTKRFQAGFGVHGVGFSLEAGEIVGLIGPNGAGKTTTMRLLSGRLEPDEGHIKIGGHDLGLARTTAQSLIGYLPEGGPAYPEMTARAYLAFVCAMHGIARSARAAAVARAAAAAGAETVLGRVIGALSKGLRLRVGLAAALVHDPQVLLLDEPTDGLDPHQRESTLAFVAGMAGRRAVIMSTHHLDDAETVCTRIIVMAKGEIRADASLGTLSQTYGGLVPAYRALTTPQERAP
jgi:ABC-2 type transport system ATP-binding protein